MPETPSGFLLIDKPVGPTSHDVIDSLREKTGIRKIGHAGTLDPLASGLLIIAVGAATKQLSSLVGLNKSYEGEITLGRLSTTDDAEGELTSVSDGHPSEAELREALARLTGELSQLPPAYSARKQRGVKGYEAARQGKVLSFEPRAVTVHSLELTGYAYPKLTFRVSVSSGTYIRSLARDLGEALGTGAYLSALRRTEIGEYRVEDAASVEALDDSWVDKLFNIS